MSALPSRNDRWSALGVIARWRRRGTGLTPEPESSGTDEVKRCAQEPDPSPPELLSLSSHGLYGSNLLERRMVALNLDPEEVARSEPALFRGFQRLCTSCRSPMRCAQDLAQEFARDPSDPASTEWRDYCPNGTTLNMLSTLKKCSEG
jgi:hypothetical protein